MAMADPASLSRRYQVQLAQTVETLRQRAQTAKTDAETAANDYKAKLISTKEQFQPQAETLVNSYKDSIMDLDGAVPANASPFLLKTYLWIGVCLLAFTIGRIASGLLLFPVIGAVFDNWTAVLLTYAFLPAFVYLYLRKVQMTETEREQTVLFGSIGLGVLIGSLMCNRYVTIFCPPVVLLPISIGLASHAVAGKEQLTGNRRAFVGALLAGALVGFVLFGFVFNFGLSYILYMLLLCGVAGADLQLKLASIQRNDSSPQLEQWKTVVILATTITVANFLFSRGKEAQAEIAAAVPATDNQQK